MARARSWLPGGGATPPDQRPCRRLGQPPAPSPGRRSCGASRSAGLRHGRRGTRRLRGGGRQREGCAAVRWVRWAERIGVAGVGWEAWFCRFLRPVEWSGPALAGRRSPSRSLTEAGQAKSRPRCARRGQGPAGFHPVLTAPVLGGRDRGDDREPVRSVWPVRAEGTRR
jgi:hypothetical protein